MVPFLGSLANGKVPPGRSLLVKKALSRNEDFLRLKKIEKQKLLSVKKRFDFNKTKSKLEYFLYPRKIDISSGEIYLHFLLRAIITY